jgi:hypothetical protein
MPRSDDSSLDEDGLRAVHAKARDLLNRAEAWDRFPTPVDDILAAANLKVAASNAFDIEHIMAFLRDKAEDAKRLLSSALSKVFGVLDAQDGVIHIDRTVASSRQTFLKLHEAGHHELPVHRRLFSIFQDDEKTLDPGTAQLLEREANNFARFALFQDGRFGAMAADLPLSIKTPLRLGPKFGASIYAASREFARTNHRECLVYVLEPVEIVAGDGYRAHVRRTEYSPTFLAHFGPSRTVQVTPDHPLGRAVPIGRKLTRPFSLAIPDLNGDQVEAVAEGFDTGRNVILLLYSKRSLTASTASGAA